MEAEEIYYASPDKLSSVEVYGFIGWIATYLLFSIFNHQKSYV